ARLAALIIRWPLTIVRIPLLFRTTDDALSVDVAEALEAIEDLVLLVHAVRVDALVRDRAHVGATLHRATGSELLGEGVEQRTSVHILVQRAPQRVERRRSHVHEPRPRHLPPGADAGPARDDDAPVRV